MTFSTKARLLVILAMCLSAPWASANQFIHQTVNSYEVYRYDWLDYSQHPVALQMALSSDFVSSVGDDPKMRIHEDQIGPLILRKVEEAARQLSDSNYSLEVKQDSGGINVMGTGVDQVELQRRLNEIHAVQAQVISVLRSSTYLWVSDENEVSFNYQQMIADSLPTLKPLIDTWPVQSIDLRGQFNSYLGFLQAIPYNSLEESTDFGVLTPAAMLTQNRGDCETKQVALAAFIKSGHPQLGVILVGTGNHMILGALIAAEPGDSVFRYKGRDYVLMDATGPARSPVGAVDSESRGHLSNEDSEVFEIP